MSGSSDVIAFDSHLPVTLPCGRRITVAPLDGHAQKRLAPDREGKFHDAEGAITFALTRTIKTLDSKTYDPKTLDTKVRAMPGGSRLRAFMAARTLTYGSACKLDWQCQCGKKNSTTRDLDAGLPDRSGGDGGARDNDAERRVEDIAYPANWRDGFTFNVPAAGRSLRVRVCFDTGATAVKFDEALARGDVSTLDSTLAQVVELDGKPLSQRDPFGDVLSLPGNALDAIRKVVAMMEPREFLDADDERAYVEKTNALFVALGNPAPETSEVTESDDGEAPPPKMIVPQGGPRLKLHLRCAGCGRASWVALTSSPDFFLRHLSELLDD